MKHNTCVMRGRSLHRRLLARQPLPALLPAGSVVSTASGVAVLPSLEEARHSRQNSRDSNRSSSSLLHPTSNRNGSMEPETGSRNAEAGTVGKNIEIYATLPKKKGKKAAEMLNLLGDAGSWMPEAPLERQSRSSSTSTGGFATVRRERAKSEERKSKPVPIPSTRIDPEEAFRMSAGDASSDNSISKSPGKKQHRIRRRLLMGGLIKRKNRSLPDLRADEEEAAAAAAAAAAASGAIQMDAEAQVSEELSSSNFNLERSKLMRRQTSGACGTWGASSVTSVSPSRSLVKVPPPPPLRKTSHLSASKLEAPLDFHPADYNPADLYDHPVNNYRK